MKKIILIVFCAIVFASCLGVEPAVFTDNNTTSDNGVFSTQFIVEKIEKIDKDNCLYVSKKYNYIASYLFATKSSFVAKQGSFQIGDTVTVCKFTKK